MASSMLPQSVHAEEAEGEAAQASEQIAGTEEPEAEEGAAVQEPENADTAPDEQGALENPPEEAGDATNIDSEPLPVEEADIEEEPVSALAEQRLNYVYVESPYLEAPNTQNIVVSWGDGTEEISDVRLVYQKEGGEEEEWAAALNVQELFLFSKEFSEADSGSYKVHSIRFIQNEEEQEFLLSDLEAVAEFGVNQEYAGYNLGTPAVQEEEPGEPIVSEEAGVTVVSIDENGEVSGEESLEAALAEAAAATAPASVSPKRARARTAQAPAPAADAKSSAVIVALDPGHDSVSGGASYNGLSEEVLTLKIARYVKEELEKYDNVDVYMTRTGAGCPTGVGASNHAGQCIRERVRLAAAAGAQYFVSIHLNASTNKSVGGAEVIVPNSSWKPEQNVAGTELAEHILDQLVRLGLTRRTIYYKNATDGDTYEDGSTGDYFSVQNAGKDYNLPGIIVEHAFISNSGGIDQSLLSSEEGLRKLGVADATGIAQYLGLRKSSGGFTGWKNEGGKYYYYRNGKAVTGKHLIGQQIYYFDSKGVMQTGWQTVDGKRCYFYSSGAMVTGTVVINGATYTFGDDGGLNGWLLENQKYYYYKSGVKATGWQYIGNQYYYFNSRGEMQTGLQTIGGQKYYFYPSGNMVTGWVTLSGKKYYFYPSGSAAVGKVAIGGTTYEFDKDGVLKGQVRADGWHQENGKYYYYSNGKAQTGLQTIGGQKYYFDSKGVMQTGWQTVSGKKYYFYPSGSAVVGKATIGGKIYEFDQGGILKGEIRSDGWYKENEKTYYYKGGKPQTGWQYIGSQYYYFNGKGEMVTGLQTIGGQKYYFNARGEMQTGWQTIGGKKYYFYPSGSAVTGKETIGGKLYEFGRDGVLKREIVPDGWHQEKGIYYYYKDGKAQTGLHKIEGQKYYFNDKGEMQTGWKTVSGQKYYFYPSGSAVVGKETIGGVVYEFDQGGVLRGEFRLDGWNQESDGTYYYYKGGTAQTGWQYIGVQYYYFNSRGEMQTGLQTIGGQKYYFYPSGSMVTGWVTLSGKKYYFYPTGSAVTGKETINGTVYEFDQDGVLIGEVHNDGWKQQGGTYYYYKNGKAVTGLQTLGGETYYFSSTGAMQTGWQTISGKQYYFYPSGSMIKRALATISGQQCYFDGNGVYTDMGSLHTIMGTSRTTVDKMVAYYNNTVASIHKSYPSAELKKGGAGDIRTFCQMYFEEAQKEGVRAEVAFAQAMQETGYLQFGGDVKIGQYNFAGLGATGGGEPGNSFPDVRTGIRAQIQHLKCYASKAALNQACVDQRWSNGLREKAPYVEWLSIPHNPYKTGWAGDANYGSALKSKMNQIM